MHGRSYQIVRRCSTHARTNYFITTPIYYVNASPHIGHLYSSVIADAAQRWQCLKNDVKIKFVTGTDEHGSKIQQAAKINNVPVDQYCREVSGKYKQLAEHFNISYTDFIRTTDADHTESVKKLWRVLKDNGHIYSGKYRGWYCVSDETFLTDSQLKEIVTADGSKVTVSAESGHPVEWTEEQNYIFRLSAFRDDLRHWLSQNEGAVRPAKFHRMLAERLEREPLADVSVSRAAARVPWGLPVPEDASQTVYVWLDALANYLTAAGYARLPDTAFRETWPPDVHVVGKDILKFHGIYWPAFLMAAGLEPPRSILCHSHWTVDGEKMSKSKNNVVCPFDRSHIYTADGLRYFLLREGVAHSDGNYSDTKVVRILNSELADTLGNLLSRCCGVVLNPDQVIPEIKPAAFAALASRDVTRELVERVAALPEACHRHYEDFNFYKAADAVMATLHAANAFFEALKPWELRKRPDEADALDAVLHVTGESLRVCGALLQPLTPALATRVLDKLAVPADQRVFSALARPSWSDPDFRRRPLAHPHSATVLFARIAPDKEKESAGAKQKKVKR